MRKENSSNSHVLSSHVQWTSRARERSTQPYYYKCHLFVLFHSPFPLSPSVGRPVSVAQSAHANRYGMNRTWNVRILERIEVYIFLCHNNNDSMSTQTTHNHAYHRHDIITFWQWQCERQQPKTSNAKWQLERVFVGFSITTTDNDDSCVAYVNIIGRLVCLSSRVSGLSIHFHLHRCCADVFYGFIIRQY